MESSELRAPAVICPGRSVVASSMLLPTSVTHHPSYDDAGVGAPKTGAPFGCAEGVLHAGPCHSPPPSNGLRCPQTGFAAPTQFLQHQSALRTVPSFACTNFCISHITEVSPVPGSVLFGEWRGGLALIFWPSTTTLYKICLERLRCAGGWVHLLRATPPPSTLTIPVWSGQGLRTCLLQANEPIAYCRME